MEYVNCICCNKKMSKKSYTRLSKKCNICNARSLFHSYTEKVENNIIFIDKWKNDYMLGFINFIRKSENTTEWKYRVVLLFERILEDISNKPIDETCLDNMFNNIKAYKNKKFLEVIKVYLFSKKHIKFEYKYQVLDININDYFYYKNDIINYYFEEKSCKVCGNQTSGTNKTCGSCIVRHSLIRYLEKKYNIDWSNDIKKLQIEYMNFLILNKLSIMNLLQHIKYSRYIFEQLNNAVIDKKGKILSIDGDELKAIMNPYWLKKIYEGKSSNSNEEAKFLKIIFNYLVGFMSYNKYINNFDKSIQIEIDKNNNITVNFNKSNIYNNIKDKINSYPSNFHMLLEYFLTILEKQSKNYIEKNSIKSLNIESIYNNFNTVFNLLDYLRELRSITNWTEITQRDINKYHLTFDNLRHRTVINNKLYNFFDFALKNKFIVTNPVDKLQYREYSMYEESSTKQDHNKVFSIINILLKEDKTTALISMLIYYHALTSRQLIELRLKDIDLNKKCIYISGRPPVYLDDEYHLIINYLNEHKKNIEELNIKNLFYVIHMGVVKRFNNNKILSIIKKDFNLTPFKLRQLGIQYCAQNFGVQYLHDCLGISWTHMNRYGEFEDSLLNEMVTDMD